MGADMIYESCKNCGFRIGTHSIRESFKCGLITKKNDAPYNKKKIIYNETTKKYEYKN